MITGQESRRMGVLLRSGFLADRALIQLSGIDPNRPVVGDHVLLRSLITFFEAAAKSVDLETPHRAKLGATSNARAAALLDWKSIATYEKVSDTDGFKNWIEARRQTIERIDKEERVSADELDVLKSLLEAVGRLSLTQAQALRQSGEADRARKSWHLALRS
jgi:hypothetical protein